MAEQVSIREFARRVGVSDVAVAKAIKAGKIVHAVDYSNPKRPKIDPELAAKEWGRNHDPSYDRTEKLTETVVVNPPTPKAAQPKKPRAVKPKAEKPKAEKPKVDVVPSESEQVEQDTAPVQFTGDSLAEIKRQQAKVRLHISALDLKQKKGELVDKQKVYRALFSVGQEVRTTFQAIPDRVIDDILAATSRNEAHTVLFNCISDALENLSDIMNREIKI